MAEAIAAQVEYLRQVALAGKGYKEMSYELLHLRPGQRVLAVGCGAGGDLLDLADRVGEAGRVIGICPDWEVWRAAQHATAGRANIQVAVGRVEHLGFAPGVGFERVRADWVLQDVVQPWLAVAELWHVVAPGGLLELVEPDWHALMLFPAAAAGGDQYQTLHAVMEWQQRLVRHPLMGRQLPGLLYQQTRREAFAFNVGSRRSAEAVSVARAAGAACPATGAPSTPAGASGAGARLPGRERKENCVSGISPSYRPASGTYRSFQALANTRGRLARNSPCCVAASTAFSQAPISLAQAGCAFAIARAATDSRRIASASCQSVHSSDPRLNARASRRVCWCSKPGSWRPMSGWRTSRCCHSITACSV